MPETFTYSVAIRTLGTAGEKYVKLLESIKNQTIQPEKIVVVLPEGYNLPDYQIGNETFVFSRKGMIPQRIEAIKHIESQYILFCDDDVELSTDFAKKLVEALRDCRYDVSAGPLLDFFPPKKVKYLLASVLGGACVMIRGKSFYYTRILCTGGWSYNREIDAKRHILYTAESLPGTCFMARTEPMKLMAYEHEIWAEKTGYAAFEDRIMIGKLWVNGFKACVVSDAEYRHNDGKTSVRNLKLEPQYAAAFNHYIFWHRFLYSLGKSRTKKCWMQVCIHYYIFMSKLYNKMLYLLGRSTPEVYETVCKGFSDAKEFVKSDAYKQLPSPIVK